MALRALRRGIDFESRSSGEDGFDLLGAEAETCEIRFEGFGVVEADGDRGAAALGVASEASGVFRFGLLLLLEIGGWVIRRCVHGAGGCSGSVVSGHFCRMLCVGGMGRSFFNCVRCRS